MEISFTGKFRDEFLTITQDKSRDPLERIEASANLILDKLGETTILLREAERRIAGATVMLETGEEYDIGTALMLLKEYSNAVDTVTISKD